MRQPLVLHWPVVLFCLTWLAEPLTAQTYSPLYAPSSSFVDYWQCIYDGTTTPVPYAFFTTVPGYYANTNAHFHNTNRPKSSVQCTTDASYSCYSATQGYANVNGVYSFRRTATLIGQAEVLSISCQDPYYGGGRTLNTNYAIGYNDVYYNNHPEIWVRIGGDETGGGTGHGSTHYNRYMKSAAAYGLYYATLSYLAQHPEISRICTNDMALPFGGKFDISQNWTSPHSQHDRGTAADVAGIGSAQCANAGGSGVDVAAFITACVENGALATYSFNEGNHAHCGFEAPTWPH